VFATFLICLNVDEINVDLLISKQMFTFKLAVKCSILHVSSMKIKSRAINVKLRARKSSDWFNERQTKGR
jgi:hypothetical protein